MTGRRVGALLPLVLTLLLPLAGCVEVTGRPVAGPLRAGTTSGDSVGVARPFTPLPAVVLSAVPDGYDPAVDAQAGVGAALTAARADGRPVLLDFGSSWCEDCQALSTLVKSLGVHQILARNYHLVTIDVGHYDHNTALAARYVTLASSGIPALALLAPDGSLRRAGADGQFANARTLTDDQLANILVDWLYPGN